MNLNPNDKITFDIVSIHAGNNVKPFPLLVTTANGQATWIDSYGARFDRAVGRGEQPHEYSIDAQESFMHKGEKAIRTFKSISYYPQELEGHLEGEEKTQNLTARQAHELVKRHQNVIVRGKDGGNINTNQTGMLLFELRETSTIIKNNLEKTLQINQAITAATELYTEQPQEFINLCYRYGIQPIEGVAIQKLFNEVAIKINNNPSHFLTILNHEDAELLTLIKKAQVLNEQLESIISYQEPFYFMNGENLGQSEDELLYNLKKSERNKEFLMKSLNIALADKHEVVSLPKEPEHEPLSKPAQDFKRRTELARQKEAKSTIAAICRKWTEDKRADPSKVGEVDEKYTQKLREKREGYMDIADFWDAEVATRAKYV